MDEAVDTEKLQLVYRKFKKSSLQLLLPDSNTFFLNVGTTDAKQSHKKSILAKVTWNHYLKN